MTIFFSLLQTMAVFLVVGYLYCKSPWFRPLTNDHLGVKDKIYLYFFFSGLSILGTYLGHPVQDALANTRAIGPTLAGIIGGPLLGTSVGFTGGLHRFFQGGFTAFSCGLSTTVEGLIGGLLHLYLVRTNRFQDIFRPEVAFLTTMVAEIAQMAIIVAVSRPVSDAVALVKVIAFPMILTSSCGSALFMSIIRDQRDMRDRAAAEFLSRALNIAQRTLGLLTRGFDRKTAEAVAKIIHEETGVSAVAITDTEKVLSFVGTGSDHHRRDMPISSQLTRIAIDENKVVFADGLNDKFVCPISEKCMLKSTLIVPLTDENSVVGTIKLYEARNKRFLNMNKSLGEGIARLLSNQLLLSGYEQQKKLLVVAELKLLQAQVNPHFLFNSLNTIVAILRKDADRARDLLIHLSSFMRKNLNRTREFATLEEELAHVNSYLTIEKARYEDKLSVVTDIDRDLLNLTLPAFTLQPLVENAIKHGISAMLEPGVVTIKAYRENGTAIIDIEDNAGAFLENGNEDGHGIRIVDKRIKLVMGNNYGAVTHCVPHERTLVRVSVPIEGFLNDSRINC